MKAPKVDVIIAVHTPTRPVRRAVASVLDHTRADVRVTVVVHNTDPIAIRDALADFEQDERLRILSHQDGIPSPAGPMNVGLEHATGEFISLLGSDDEFAPGAIDFWLEEQRKYGAAVVIARIDSASGGIVPQPPVRPFRKGLRHPVADRLIYRSAPLGVVSRSLFGSLRLTEGLSTGEDLAYTLQLWFAGERIVFASKFRGYVLHRDELDRVTVLPREVAEEFSYLDHVLDTEWFERLSQREKHATVVKLYRVQLLGSIASRIEKDDGLSHKEMRALAVIHSRLRSASSTAIHALARSEKKLLTAGTSVTTLKEQREAHSSWRNKRSVQSVLPERLRHALCSQSALRFGIASVLLSRRGARNA